MKKLLTIILLLGVCMVSEAKPSDNQLIDDKIYVIDSLFGELNYNEASPYIEELNNLVAKTNDKYYKVLSDYYLGSILCVNSNYKEGFAKLNEAQDKVSDLPKSDKQTALSIRIKLALSGCFISCNMLSEAMHQLQEGIEENADFGDANLQVRLDNNLSALYSLMGKLDESTAIYKKMLQEPELFSRGRFYCNYNIANNFISMRQPDSALYYLNVLSDEIETKQDRLLAMKKTGDAYFLKNDLVDCIGYYESVINEIGDDTLVFANNYASAIQSYAEALHYSNREREALKVTNKALKIKLINENLVNRTQLLRLKADILSSLGRSQEAFSCLNEMLVYQDSLNKIQNLEEVNDLIVKQEILAMEKEYQHLQFVAQLKHSKERMRLFTVIVVLTGLVAIVFLLWNRKRILLKNKQIQEDALKVELESRNRELASNVVSLMKKNEVYSEIVGKLDRIKENAVKDETKEALTKVAKEIEKTMEGSFWEEFEMRFKNVHSDFYDKLIAQYPNLTNNELRLCAFLKMNLSTKDIASVTGQNPRSIDKARERLRVKLGISNDKSISLATFIQRI